MRTDVLYMISYYPRCTYFANSFICSIVISSFYPYFSNSIIRSAIYVLQAISTTGVINAIVTRYSSKCFTRGRFLRQSSKF